MSNFLKKIVVFLAIISSVFITTSLTSSPSASADTFHCEYFLGMPSWDCNITDMHSEAELTSNIVKIASNILSDITVIASYLVLGYVIYGGYLYMFSSGDPTKAAAGKKALQHAFIGLAITMSAYAIFSGIRIAFIGASNNFSDCNPLKGVECVTPGDMVVNLIQWFFGMGGVVSVIFIVVGGWGYITASGDPSKLQKAKSTIMYALIGLVIVALAEILTGFISGLIRNANDTTSFVQTTKSINVSKEDIT